LPIGTILYQRDLSHLHFEIRTFLEWSEDKPAGPGYKPAEDESKTLEDYGWLDPVEFYFTHRPPYPRAIVVNSYVPALAPGEWQRYQVPVYPEPDFDQEPITLLPTSSIVTAVGFEEARDSQGRIQRWYRVKYDGVNVGYILGFYYIGWGSDIRAGEPLGLWNPPDETPVIEYRFNRGDFTSRIFLQNWGRSGFPNRGRIYGSFYRGFGADWPDDRNDYSLVFNGGTNFVEVPNSSTLRFLRGVTVEADIMRFLNTNEDAVVSKWTSGGDQWLLTLYADGDGKLSFSVLLRNGIYANVDYTIPDLRYLENWVHVAASYDPSDGLRLYWDKELVAQKLASDLEAEGYSLGDRFVIRGNSEIHVGDANNDWSRFLGRIDNLKIWGESDVRPPRWRWRRWR
jgi:hypothetical protein